MAFSLNSYDVDLNLAVKYIRKVFFDGCVGIKEKYNESKG